MQVNSEKGAIFWCKVYGVKVGRELFCVMTYTNKMSYFAIFVIIVKFPKVRSTQFELVTNCHRLTLKLVRGLKNLFFQWTLRYCLGFRGKEFPNGIRDNEKTKKGGEKARNFKVQL